MSENRILIKKIKEYLLTESPNRNFIIDYVKKSLDKGIDSVALCFRGDYATLYYRCHQLLRIKSSRNRIIGEFDFRHSRFTKDYREKRKLLESYGVDFSKFSEENASCRYIRFHLNGIDAIEKESLAKILEIYKGLIIDFITPELNEYQYDIPKSVKDKICRNKTKNIEKNRQQQLYAENFYCTDETFYDLEYIEPRAKEKGVAGRIDLLGIKRNGDGYLLELVELKSTLAACDGNAGIDKHQNDYLNYLRHSECVKERKIEVCETIRLLHEILDKPCSEDLSPDKIEIAIKFIFTDEAKARGERYNPPQGIMKEII